jgi:hypothetical protein
VVSDHGCLVADAVTAARRKLNSGGGVQGRTRPLGQDLAREVGHQDVLKTNRGE